MGASSCSCSSTDPRAALSNLGKAAHATGRGVYAPTQQQAWLDDKPTSDTTTRGGGEAMELTMAYPFQRRDLSPSTTGMSPVRTRLSSARYASNQWTRPTRRSSPVRPPHSPPSLSRRPCSPSSLALLAAGPLLLGGESTRRCVPVPDVSLLLQSDQRQERPPEGHMSCLPH